MSSDGPGQREVAHRIFATEFEDATVMYSQSDEERAPNYVITPTGARVNRLFVVGVLTEVERVNEDVVRARVVDPTGAFVLYASQYQPEALAFLDRTEPPAYVAVTGKANTFRPDGSDRVFTSIRPERINIVDEDTRDRWIVHAAQHTIERVRAFATAVTDTSERSDDSSGIAIARERYGTTPTYLSAIRTVSIDAIRLVSGQIDAIDPLRLDPGDGDESTSFSELQDIAPRTVEPGALASRIGTTTDTSVAESSRDDRAPLRVDRSDEVDIGTNDATVARDTTDESTGPTTSTQPAIDSLSSEGDAGTDDYPDSDVDVLDAEERKDIEKRYGTEFTTGDEFTPAGDDSVESTEDDTTVRALDTRSEESSVEELVASRSSNGETGTPDATSEVETTLSTDPTAEATTQEQSDSDSVDTAVDSSNIDSSQSGIDENFESIVVDAMRSLDDGDGANRATLIETVSGEHEVETEVIEEAIKAALMSGQCYEPADGVLKPI